MSGLSACDIILKIVAWTTVGLAAWTLSEGLIRAGSVRRLWADQFGRIERRDVALGLGWATIAALGWAAVIALKTGGVPPLLWPTTLPLVLTLGGAIVGAFALGAAEELIFRGILPDVLPEHWGTWSVGVTSAIAFAVTHGANARTYDMWSLLALATLGLAMYALRVATSSVWAPTLAHATYNVLNWLVFGTGGHGHGPWGGLTMPQHSTWWWGSTSSAGLGDCVVMLAATLLTGTWWAMVRQEREVLTEAPILAADDHADAGTHSPQ